ncbi:MAG: FHA domain-containing protein, partial [Myxococcota bacterium]
MLTHEGWTPSSSKLAGKHLNRLTEKTPRTVEQAHAQTSLKLIIEDDEGRRSVVPIDLGEATVGRDEDNTIRLNERNVSRHHARIRRDNGQVVAEDLDSYNGVFINGDRVRQRQDLHEGDILRVGDFQLELRGEGLSRRTEETTVRAGPPETAEITRPSIRIDEGAPRDGTMRDPTDYDDEEEGRSEPTAIIRADQVQGDPDRSDSQAMVSESRARLLCVSTQFAGREFEIEREEAVIGRTDDNDIAVDHRSVSRHHAKIMFTGKAFRIIDMKSANGTLVNGEEYAQIELKAGDLIELGHVKFRFVPPGGHYAFSAEELSAISASSHANPQAPVEELAPVAEYEPPRETTNPGVGSEAQRVATERGSS